jgi:molecular chaperone DnaK (HSP70)
LDVSILHVSDGYCEVMGSDGDDRLGGADFDVAVANVLAQQHSTVLQDLESYWPPSHDQPPPPQGLFPDTETFISSCHRITDELPLCSRSSFHTLGEALKISLSNTSGTSATAMAQCLALPPVEHVRKTAAIATSAVETNEAWMDVLCQSLYVQPLPLTLEEYNTACQHLLDRSIVPVTRLLNDLTLSPDDMDEIVMVGGTTRMPQIRQLVRQAFPQAELNTHIDPDITVAYGAASVID